AMQLAQMLPLPVAVRLALPSWAFIAWKITLEGSTGASSVTSSRGRRPGLHGYGRGVLAAF
ncbi:hypothetical protein ACWDA8_31905, partial [Streptomyces sp. NPDC001130]